MTNEDVSITEVMYRIQTQSYFTKAFKNEFGKTPSQFLKDLKKWEHEGIKTNANSGWVNNLFSDVESKGQPLATLSASEGTREEQNSCLIYLPKLAAVLYLYSIRFGYTFTTTKFLGQERIKTCIEELNIDTYWKSKNKKVKQVLI